MRAVVRVSGLDWTLDGLAGQGAVAVVWRAHCDGRTAALKIAKSPEADGLVASEGRLLLGCPRQWGAQVWSSGQVEQGPDVCLGRACLVSEWVSGTSLSALEVDEVGRGAAENRAAEVAFAVGSALAELHDLGLVHGDVKPENLIWRRDRDPSTGAIVMLLDFSLASQSDAPARGATIRYSAPGASMRASPADDVYALGLVLAEVLDSSLCALQNPAEQASAWEGTGPRGWARMMLAGAAGARPTASWIAQSARAWLKREPVNQAAKERWRVRATYLATRSTELTEAYSLDESLQEPVREWLSAGATQRTSTNVLCALDATRRRAWLLRLLGAGAARWIDVVDGKTDAQLAERLLTLADRGTLTAALLSDLGDELALPIAELDDARRGALLATGLASDKLIDDIEAQADSSNSLTELAAEALSARGQYARAAALYGKGSSPMDLANRAEAERRAGNAANALLIADSLRWTSDLRAASVARATIARVKWQEGDVDAASGLLLVPGSCAECEVRALLEYSRGELESALEWVGKGIDHSPTTIERARLDGVRAMVEHARGESYRAMIAFERAVDHAARAGAIIDEATYLTGLAAAAVDAGDTRVALKAAERSALLWEYLGRPADGARACLAEGSALLLLGATQAADVALGRAMDLAVSGRDARAFSYAVLERSVLGVAQMDEAEIRKCLDDLKRSDVADDLLIAAAYARRIFGEGSNVDDVRRGEVSTSVKWDYWCAELEAWVPSAPDPRPVLEQMAARIDLAVPVRIKIDALFAAETVAGAVGATDVAGRFASTRQRLVASVLERAPEQLRAGARARSAFKQESLPSNFDPAQLAALATIMQLVSQASRLKPLVEQVLDSMLLWTGAERGILFLKRRSGEVSPRVIRNLDSGELKGEAHEASHSLVLRALEKGAPVVAVDGFSDRGSAHRSMHAALLRRAIAVPLIARGRRLGVVYLDDRNRPDAFSSVELAWVNLLAGQAAVAVANVRDRLRLRRALRKSEIQKKRVDRALGRRERELREAQSALVPELDGMIGASPAIVAMKRLVLRVAPSDLPVLVLGESGTGKELVARVVHVSSPRRKKMFVAENCAALPEPLLEATLFGYERGAFTGATTARTGLFEVAHGGTLFLDEIGEMSPSLQAKLLRVLQDGELRPLGATKVKKVDVRLVCATHRDLEKMVSAGTFREDLWYRLNVVAVRVPPLRERREDIVLLADHFVAKYGVGRTIAIAPDAMRVLNQAEWPGNVRQLENELRRAMVMAEGRIEASDLSSEVSRAKVTKLTNGGALRSRVDALEVDAISDALRETHGNQSQAAKRLGVSRYGLLKMMKRLGIREA